MTSPLLWYANRGTGLVLLVLYTVTVVLGLVSTRRGPGSPWWPRFVTQGLHRSVSALTSVLLVLHVLSAVVDEYVDIRWWDAVVPVGGLYKPLYLGLGALALDLTVLVVLTSLARSRLPERAWRALHLLSYPAWGVALVHTVGIGTDVPTPWLRILLAACVGVVAAAVFVRTTARRLAPERP